ncbi:tonB-like protein [Asticcacaulis biprosthecium C19]|uniref:TonB-like protein n=1 Tax=Asticcacaulis biprosthecium C19 TaxID=715226 RepID=F4QKQ9_9CAUL|nr:tonB-like protein [Asticcacaulis biprosthecium C19]
MLAIAYIGWATSAKPVRVTAVAVEIISDVTSREMVATPVDELAVNKPEPVPSEADVAVPEPDAQPAPEPQKPAAPAKPDKKPEPIKKDKAPPDPKGKKAPVPDKKAPQPKTLDLDNLSNPPPAPKNKGRANPNTQQRNGGSLNGSGPQDAGEKAEMAALTKRLGRLWRLNCDIPGTRQVKIVVGFQLSRSGRLIKGPTWVNRRSDAVWVSNSQLAIAAVNRGAPFTDLSDGLYERDLEVEFDAEKVCRGY